MLEGSSNDHETIWLIEEFADEIVPGLGVQKPLPSRST